jgi:phosphatidylserine/phosphatidylglycerophosphate/cardiolipin synthase-like enzyme
MQPILDLFIKALEDQVLTNEEANTLVQAMGEQDLKAQDIGFLRNRLADFAKTSLALEGSSPLDVLKWLERTNKIFSRFDKEIAAEGGTKASAFFAPNDNCQKEICDFIKKSIVVLDICVFTISDDDITKAIVSVHKKGVKVRLITDNDKMQDLGSDVQRLHRAGIPIKTDATANHMHHKFAISDRVELLTGSYNWTRSAHLHNHENILITEQKALIASYHAEFEHLWQELKPYTI